MSITHYVAQQTVRMAEALAHFLQTTPQERLAWQPQAEAGATTRSALEQTGECVQVNRLMAALLRGETVAPPPAGGWPEMAFADTADAQAWLLASAQELASAIEALPEEALDREFSHPRGPMRGSNLILMGYRNMAYHAGQINFIQILAGDAEFHLPPNWR